MRMTSMTPTTPLMPTAPMTAVTPPAPVTLSGWQPKWYAEEHVTAWARIKEALRRDWEQTKHDLGLPGGHQLNQGIEDTIKQAARTEPIPADDLPNRPKVIGRWDEAEYPIGYGYTARRALGGVHPTWNEGLEQKLRAEWEARNDVLQERWEAVIHLVRYGYEYPGPH